MPRQTAPDAAISASPSAAPDALRRLTRQELPSDTVALARFLIGKTLVHDIGGARLSGRIVETEAYLVGDAASHAFRGETRRNRSMFLPRGHAYVYISYGCWPMLNVSAGDPGEGTAVLIRALEPLTGIENMRERRGDARVEDLARGPGRTAVAMGISLGEDGLDLCGAGPLWLGSGPRKLGKIGVSTRIGITKDAERPLRLFEIGSPFVSGPRKLNLL
jgi:DNA-3-methyladenine glycosylase